MAFEWDSEKRRENLRKHGLDFVDAVQVFFDTARLEQPDRRRVYGEERIQVIGQAHGRTLCVVYTWRGHTRRLISARRASRQERRAYHARCREP